MTKLTLFKIFGAVFLLVAVIAACAIEDKLVVKSLKNVKTYCYQIEDAVDRNDGIVNNEVANLVDNLQYDWAKNEKKLCLLVNHKSIEQLAVEVVRLKTYIDEEEEIEFFTSLEIIKNYVETFQHFMGASFHNIL